MRMMDDFYIVRFDPVWHEEPDDATYEDEEYKDLYAFFGLAIYRANCLEHSLVNVFAVNKLITAYAQGEEVMSDPFAQGFRDMMSKLIKRAQPHINQYPEILEDLTSSLNRRNYLVHNFWRERILDIYSAAGRIRLRAELEEDCTLFQRTDQRLCEKVLDPIVEKIGVTAELIKAYLDEEERKLPAEDGEAPPR